MQKFYFLFWKSCLCLSGFIQNPFPYTVWTMAWFLGHWNSMLISTVSRGQEHDQNFPLVCPFLKAVRSVWNYTQVHVGSTYLSFSQPKAGLSTHTALSQTTWIFQLSAVTLPSFQVSFKQGQMCLSNMLELWGRPITHPSSLCDFWQVPAMNGEELGEKTAAPHLFHSYNIKHQWDKCCGSYHLLL